MGEYDFSHIQEQLPYIERAVSKKVVHPKYNFFTYEHDLALVKLEQPLEFAPHISPICLPATDDLLIGENATVTGWGRLSEGGTLPSVLQEVSWIFFFLLTSLSDMLGKLFILYKLENQFFFSSFPHILVYNQNHSGWYKMTS